MALDKKMYKMHTTKHKLFGALADGTLVELLLDGEIREVMIDSIEREDGSCKCWNIVYRRVDAGSKRGKTYKGFVRTID